MQDSYDGKGINWVEFYDRYLPKPSKPAGSKKRNGLSPFREERTPSFWFNTENGLWKDEGTGASGNPTTFLAAVENITTSEAARRLDELAGVVRDKPTRKRKKAAAKPKTDETPYDVATYARDKGLDADKLVEWGLSSWKNKVVIPYKTRSGEVACTRFRQPPGYISAQSGKEQRFAWKAGSAGKIIPYGLWLLDSWPSDCDLVLVEGESDAHALWSLGIPALGIPGASYFRPEWTAYVEGHDVFIHDEQNPPDEKGLSGSITFIRHTASSLHEAGYKGRAAVFATPGDVKDPSDLFSTQGEAASNLILEALRGAQSLDIERIAQEDSDRSYLARFGLKCPRGYIVDERGIMRYDEMSETMKRITATPVVITARVIDARGRGERVRLTFIRGKAETELVADRDLAFSARGIVTLLAPLGAQITSEDAKSVVRFLGALEATNLDEIPAIRSTRELGWCGSAFMPTNDNGLLLDMPPGGEEVVDAFGTLGSREEWLEAMKPHRESSPVFRFLLASGVAPTLLKATGGRIVFVYNWAASRGGKTAALKAAVSAWGDPELLMTTFNATSVGLERRAVLFRDLPLAIDERQAAYGRQETLDQIVMSIASGTGRVRGARDGGLQEQQHWRTIAIATGEEPLSGSTSKTGVSTRVIEIFGSPFSDEAAAADMHKLTTEHYGHIGPAFVDKVVEIGDGGIKALQGILYDRIAGFSELYASSHLSGISTVLAADVLLSMHFYGMELEEAMRQATELGIAIIGRVEVAKSGDVDEAALLYIEDWLAANESHFSSSSFNTVVFGEKRGESSYLIYPSELRKALETAGFSYRKTLKALTERDAVKLGADGGATTSQRVYGTQKRVVWIEGSKLGTEQDPTLFESVEAKPGEAF